MKGISPVIKKVTARKRQPKKTKVVSEKMVAEEELPLKVKAKRSTKKTAAKRTTIKTNDKNEVKAGKVNRRKKVKFASGTAPASSEDDKESSLATLLDRLDAVAERVDRNASCEVSSMFTTKRTKSTKMTSKQLASLKMVLSDSYNELSF